MSKGSSKYVIKRTVTGLGLFATALIPAGKRIIEYTGTRITNEEVARRKTGKYFFGLDEMYSIDGTPRTNIAVPTERGSLDHGTARVDLVEARHQTRRRDHLQLRHRVFRRPHQAGRLQVREMRLDI